MYPHPIMHESKPRTLANGAEIIQQAGNYVLAHWRGEYVTWYVDRDGHTEHGKYFPYRTVWRPFAAMTKTEAEQAAWRSLGERRNYEIKCKF